MLLRRETRDHDRKHGLGVAQEGEHGHGVARLVDVEAALEVLEPLIERHEHHGVVLGRIELLRNELRRIERLSPERMDALVILATRDTDPDTRAGERDNASQPDPGLVLELTLGAGREGIGELMILLLETTARRSEQQIVEALGELQDEDHVVLAVLVVLDEGEDSAEARWRHTEVGVVVPPGVLEHRCLDRGGRSGRAPCAACPTAAGWRSQRATEDPG